MTIVMTVLPIENASGSLLELYTRKVRRSILQEEEKRLTKDYRRQLIAERLASKASQFYTYKNGTSSRDSEERDTITFYMGLPLD